MSELRVSAVVPAFNEGAAVGEVVKALAATLKPATADFEIVVVDDGSTDDTAARAAAAGAVVVRHPVNRGYGRSLMSGFAKAKHPWILMIDADGSYPPEEAAKLLPFAPDFDLVIGARQGANYWGTPWQAARRWIYLSLAGFVAGEKIPDANSGLRLLSRAAFDRSMPFLCLGYSFTTTMTLSFTQAGRFVRYEPVRFVERVGKSKVKFARDILRTLQIMAQMMIYYNPLKLAVTASAALTALAALSGEVVLFATAVVVFFLGCVLDAIRLHFEAAKGPAVFDAR